MPQLSQPQSAQQANYLAFVAALRDDDTVAAQYLISNDATFELTGQPQPLDFGELVQHRQLLREVFPGYGKDAVLITIIEQGYELVAVYDVTATVDDRAITIRCADVVTFDPGTRYITNVKTITDRLPLLAPECDALRSVRPA